WTSIGRPSMPSSRSAFSTSRTPTRVPDTRPVNQDGPGADPALGGVVCFERGGLYLVSIIAPPPLVARRKVRPATISSDGAVDQLAKDVGVACVAIDVGDHVHEGSM